MELSCRVLHHRKNGGLYARCKNSRGITYWREKTEGIRKALKQGKNQCKMHWYKFSFPQVNVNWFPSKQDRKYRRAGIGLGAKIVNR